MAEQHHHQIYEFDSFCLDTRERVLLRDGRPVSLKPKVYETLLALISQSGHVVDKEELMRRVWPDVAVEENNRRIPLRRNTTSFWSGRFFFAPAAVKHRFENFSEDFAVWVLFYGPEGGEGESGNANPAN